jgi:uncharacterized membrane protein YeaQ/YmgE (transglycosylase-associated protein family)
MAVVNTLAWIIAVITSWLASLLVRGGGMGIVGALIGAFLLSLLLPGTFGFTGFNLGSLIFIVKLFTGRRAVS